MNPLRECFCYVIFLYGYWGQKEHKDSPSFLSASLIPVGVGFLFDAPSTLNLTCLLGGGIIVVNFVLNPMSVWLQTEIFKLNQNFGGIFWSYI